MHPIWLVALLALATPIAGRAWFQRRRQMQDLMHLARRRGLTFASLDVIGLHERYHNLELLRRGHNRHAWNIIYGTTEAGLVAVFRYSYDVGFGVHQYTQQLWMAVLETSQPLPGWQTHALHQAGCGGEEHSTRVAAFEIKVDRLETLEFLRRYEVSVLLRSVPDCWHIESQSSLLAVAAPFDADTTTPERMLTTLTGLAQMFRRAAG